MNCQWSTVFQSFDNFDAFKKKSGQNGQLRHCDDNSSHQMHETVMCMFWTMTTPLMQAQLKTDKNPTKKHKEKTT